MTLIRPSGREYNQLREIKFETNVNNYAEGSCLVTFGNTKVLCTASIEEKVPHFLKGKNQGWITAEYSMLPRATHTRNSREAAKGKLSGRTQEIQRLIGRALRAAIDLNKIPEICITIDCDVLQADGGTRTAAINGGFIALKQCTDHLLKSKVIKSDPVISNLAAISCGIYFGTAIADLDYEEDSKIDVDANFVFNQDLEIIEIQASSEENTCNKNQFNEMLELAENACQLIIDKQNEACRN